MSDTELNRLWLELERRRMEREQSASEQMARARADLIAAFGEGDVAGATGTADTVSGSMPVQMTPTAGGDPGCS